MDLSKVVPMGVNTILKVDAQESISKLIITDKTEKYLVATVVNVGKDAGTEVGPGDKIIMLAAVANQFKMNTVEEGTGNDYRLVPIEYILGKFKPE